MKRVKKKYLEDPTVNVPKRTLYRKRKESQINVTTGTGVKKSHSSAYVDINYDTGIYVITICLESL